MIEAMQKKAGQLGAHAIILVTINEPAALEKVVSQAVFAKADAYIRVERTGEAIAIRFLETDEHK